jgi:putative photosynthetic complex assembly protein 2
MNFWLDVLPSVVAAMLLWWGATGIIIFLCGRKQWRPWVFGAVCAIQPLAFWQLWATRNHDDVGGVFASFFWAVIIWSWIEVSYYTGFIVGRNVPELEPDAPTGLRFRRAIAANLYHELFIILLSIAVIIVGWGGQNEVGLWAFMILHWTHQSAKINIFLGVNNLTSEYLPDNLKYMAQYFSKRSLNSFFPFSVTISIVITTLLFNSILSANQAGQMVGQAVLFVMMSAAILEHWWLVTPVPTKAWEWALKSRKAETSNDNVTTRQPATEPSKPSVQIICGYLGSGKTTLIRHLLPQLNERVAVIVNDFGVVGVDAELIRAEGAAGMVVELPGGCICCTLQKNLTGQIVDLLEAYRPERLIIEPSGVAGIEEIVKALASPRLTARLGQMEVVAVMDASRLNNPNNLKTFTLTQIRAANAIVINKIDLVTANEVSQLIEMVESLNPLARCLTALEGRISARELLGLAESEGEGQAHHSHNWHEEAGMISFGREYEGFFDPRAVQDIFEMLAAGYFGPVERAKGIFLTPTGRQSWDLAAGRVRSQKLPPSSISVIKNSAQPLTSRFMVVAADLAAEELNKQLEKGIITKNSASQPNANQDRTNLN